MYDWLGKLPATPPVIVTANRRLARLLNEEYGRRQIAAGNIAWRSPEIRSWHDWLSAIFSTASEQESLPARINSQHAQILWERCLRKEFGDDATGISAIARTCRDAWQRASDALVDIRDIARAARSDDHRLFASVAGRYVAILEHENWIDAGGIAARVAELVRMGNIAIPADLALAGFDREPASLQAVCAALADKGCRIERVPAANHGSAPVSMRFENADSELRAAGAWARRILEQNPSARIAVVKQRLEQTAARDARLVREGAVPGWQYAPTAVRECVNVSFGQRLSDYPAIQIALLALRWLAGNLPSRDVATLLLSPLFGGGGLGARARLELQLRDMPDRRWSPAMVSAALRRGGGDANGSDWLGRIAGLSKRRRDMPARMSPAEWATWLHDTLEALGWPGAGSVDSETFQLINRWRELLNELARLDLVASSLSMIQVTRRLELMAADTVFQAESTHAPIQLLGALEASGAEFDALWLAGLSAADWPPPGRPTALIARSLQVDRDMPDATPADTLAFAHATMSRLIGSADSVVCSYAVVVDDTEQTASEMLRGREFPEAAPHSDPGWHAVSLAQSDLVVAAEDSVPPIDNETLFGGAGTIERQLAEPLSAFVYGRLGAGWLSRQAVGITPQLRGNVLHDALYRLYAGLPDRAEISGWRGDDLRDRIATALAAAFVRHEHNTDDVLAELLRLERARMAGLVESFVQLDAARDDFAVAAVEGTLEFRRGNVRLSLRFDRIDRLDDGGIAILDYKTGKARSLLQNKGQEVSEPQLFVYAMAANDTVDALALINIDAREISINGGGRGFDYEEFWPELLDSVTAEIEAACGDFEKGDVRIAAAQSVNDARRLNPLSRYAELARDR